MKQCRNREPDQDDDAEADTIVSEDGEAVLPDVAHQEVDAVYAHDIGDDHTEDQIEELRAGEGEAELDELQEARTEHDRYRQEEGKLCSRCTCDADQHRAEDRRARTGGTRNQCEALEETDIDRGAHIQILQTIDVKIDRFVPLLDQNEEHAIQDQHQRHDEAVIEVLIQEVIEEDTDDGRRDAGDDDLDPEIDAGWHEADASIRATTRKRPELTEEGGDDCEDRAQLDHDLEDLIVLIRLVQPDQLIDENHVSCTGDRKPLGEALHESEYDNF